MHTAQTLLQQLSVDKPGSVTVTRLIEGVRLVPPQRFHQGYTAPICACVPSCAYSTPEIRTFVGEFKNSGQRKVSMVSEAKAQELRDSMSRLISDQIYGIAPVKGDADPTSLISADVEQARVMMTALLSTAGTDQVRPWWRTATPPLAPRTVQHNLFRPHVSTALPLYPYAGSRGPSAVTWKQLCRHERLRGMAAAWSGGRRARANEARPLPLQLVCLQSPKPNPLPLALRPSLPRRLELLQPRRLLPQTRRPGLHATSQLHTPGPQQLLLWQSNRVGHPLCDAVCWHFQVWIQKLRFSVHTGTCCDSQRSHRYKTWSTAIPEHARPPATDMALHLAREQRHGECFPSKRLAAASQARAAPGKPAWQQPPALGAPVLLCGCSRGYLGTTYITGGE